MIYGNARLCIALILKPQYSECDPALQIAHIHQHCLSIGNRFLVCIDAMIATLHRLISCIIRSDSVKMVFHRNSTSNSKEGPIGGITKTLRYTVCMHTCPTPEPCIFIWNSARMFSCFGWMQKSSIKIIIQFVFVFFRAISTFVRLFWKLNYFPPEYFLHR